MEVEKLGKWFRFAFVFVCLVGVFGNVGCAAMLQRTSGTIRVPSNDELVSAYTAMPTPHRDSYVECREILRTRMQWSQNPVLRRGQEAEAACLCACGDQRLNHVNLCMAQSLPTNVEGFGVRVSCLGAMDEYAHRLQQERNESERAQIVAERELLEAQQAQTLAQSQVSSLQSDLSARDAELEALRQAQAASHAHATAPDPVSAPVHASRRAHRGHTQAMPRVRGRAATVATPRRHHVARISEGPVAVRRTRPASSAPVQPVRYVDEAERAVRASGVQLRMECRAGTVMRDDHPFRRCRAVDGTKIWEVVRAVPIAVRQSAQRAAEDAVAGWMLHPDYQATHGVSSYLGGLAEIIQANAPGGQLLLACSRPHRGGYFRERAGVFLPVNRKTDSVSFQSFRSDAPQGCGGTQVWVPGPEWLWIPMEASAPAVAAVPLAQPVPPPVAEVHETVVVSTASAAVAQPSPMVSASITPTNGGGPGNAPSEPPTVPSTPPETTQMHLDEPGHMSWTAKLLFGTIALIVLLFITSLVLRKRQVAEEGRQSLVDNLQAQGKSVPEHLLPSVEVASRRVPATTQEDDREFRSLAQSDIPPPRRGADIVDPFETTVVLDENVPSSDLQDNSGSGPRLSSISSIGDHRAREKKTGGTPI